MGDSDSQAALFLPGHGVEGVRDQVDEDLPKTDLTTTHPDRPTRRFIIQRNAFLPHTNPRQFNRRRQNLRDIHTHSRFRLLPRKGAQVLDDPAHSTGHVRNAVKVLGSPLRIVLLQERHAVFRKGPDRHEGLVKFMADTSAHLPQRAELARLDQIGLRARQRLLRLFPLIDFVEHPQIGRRQRARPFSDPGLKLGIGLGQRLSPDGGEEQKRPERQTQRGKGRRLQ